MALAFANRSACYQKMGRFQVALRDIELALSSGYPEDKAFKLLERKAECLLATKAFDKARESFLMTIKMIKKNVGLKPAQRDKFLSAIEQKMAKIPQEVKILEDEQNWGTNDNDPLLNMNLG